ncbi:hypothetical protein ANCCAN_07294 [Ancylostoma caninum]|uniref:Uncharacterized protein n=1 Tax=Ancylostoma caninum TaxID=29170 RepID=A0A368GUI5_ANCCA|nr:hypothetical protein ANCCAN_07294 [Ancylostoma caninum]
MQMSEKMQADYDEKNKRIWSTSATNPIGVVGFIPVLKQVTITSITLKDFVGFSAEVRDSKHLFWI